MSRTPAVPSKPRGVQPAGLGFTLVLTLVLLSTIPPFATDMYLAGFPQMAADLRTTATMVQLTLTAVMVGLGAGQLFIGPLSDSVGRRRLLLVCTGLCLLASVVCALAPSIPVLIAARLLQGFAGAAGIVLARASVTDLTEGVSTLRYMNILMAGGAIAPLLAPVVGGQLVAWSGWRSVFWVITGIVGAMLVAAVLRVPESLSPDKRRSGGFKELTQGIRAVIGDRAYVAYLVTTSAACGARFAYISGSSFVLQEEMGLSARAFSLIFGLNAVGLMLTTFASVRLVSRFEALNLVRVGTAVVVVGSVVWLILVPAGLPMVPALVTLFISTSAQGLIIGNATGLATSSARGHAGTASAFLGALQFGFAALITPLVGFGYQPRTMGILMLTCAVMALAPVIRAPGSTRTAAPG